MTFSFSLIILLYQAGLLVDASDSLFAELDCSRCTQKLANMKLHTVNLCNKTAGG